MVELLDLGISTAFNYAMPFSHMIRLISEAGFGAVALGGEDVGHSGYDRVMDSYPELGLCYDSSHAYLCGTYLGGDSFEMLRTYADRVGTVHLSDGRRNVDDHLLLYEGKIDWNEFVGHFCQTGYTGTLLLEVEMASSNFTDAAAFLRKAHEGAARLQKMIEKGGQ